MSSRSSNIGGQAVIEGIMMRAGEKYAIAVRKPDQEIEVKTDTYKELPGAKKLMKVPVVRGMFAFVDSLVIGIRCLMYSASFYDDEEEPGEKKEGAEKKPLTEEEIRKKEREDSLLMTGTLIVSLIMAVGLFMLLPYLAAAQLEKVISSHWLLAFLESLIRVTIFLLYMFLISRMKDIQRTFMYHGAEHKCINCIESGKPLTVENVLQCSREHKRCGTSFLFFVMIVSAVFLMFIYTEDRVLRLVLRLVLIPVIAGVSYEIIRLAGSSDHPLVNLLSKPGLCLQRLTTREPDASQTEVAIKAVEAVFDWRKWQKEQGFDTEQ